MVVGNAADRNLRRGEPGQSPKDAAGFLRGWSGDFPDGRATVFNRMDGWPVFSSGPACEPVFLGVTAVDESAAAIRRFDGLFSVISLATRKQGHARLDALIRGIVHVDPSRDNSTFCSCFHDKPQGIQGIAFRWLF
jgi:hypothetical protein